MCSLSVSIVTYRNNLTVLAETLTSLIQSIEYALEKGTLKSAKVTIVDNGGQTDRIRSVVENIALATIAFDILANQTNVGFGRGHNQALSLAVSDYHLVLNPDVIMPLDVVDKSLRAVTSSEGCVMISPIGINEQGDPCYLRKNYPSVLALVLRGMNVNFLNGLFSRSLAHYEDRIALKQKNNEAKLASGCFMFCQSMALKKVGGFDPLFFLYFEDFDLSLRLQTIGWINFPPDIVIQHLGGKTAAKGFRHIILFAQSAFRFFQKHGWKWI